MYHIIKVRQVLFSKPSRSEGRPRRLAEPPVLFGGNLREINPSWIPALNQKLENPFHHFDFGKNTISHFG